MTPSCIPTKMYAECIMNSRGNIFQCIFDILSKVTMLDLRMCLVEYVLYVLKGYIIEAWFAIWRQGIRSSLVQVVDCRLFGAEPLHNTMMNTVNWTHRNTNHWHLNRSSNFSIQEKAYKKVVCIMLTISIWSQYVIRAGAGSVQCKTRC